MAWVANVLVGEVLDIALDILLRELAADEALDVEDGPEGVRGGLVLGGVSDKTLVIGEGDVRGGNTVSCDVSAQSRQWIWVCRVP
jgi:hypothetical protein